MKSLERSYYEVEEIFFKRRAERHKDEKNKRKNI